MPVGKKLGPSEFEKSGVKPAGVFGLRNAWEAVRMVFRTGQDTSQPDTVDLEAAPDDWGTGGLRSVHDKIE